MAVASTLALIGGISAAVGAVAAGVGTTYGIVKGEESKNEAKAATKAQADKQSALEKEATLRRQNEEGTDAAQSTANQARNRQRQLAAGAQGRSDTILTGPGGLGSPVPATGGAGGAKTLLGQ